MRNRFGNQRLARSRRAVEQNSFRRADAERSKLLLSGQRILNRLADILERSGASADIRPGNIGCLKRNLAHGRRGDFPQSTDKVRFGDLKLPQDFIRNLFVFQLLGINLTPKRDYRRLAGKGR